MGNTDFSPFSILSSTGSGWKFPFLPLGVFPFGNFFQIFLKNPLTTCPTSARITPVAASVAHLVERHLAKVEVASSSLVARSKSLIRKDEAFLLLKFKSSMPSGCMSCVALSHWDSGPAGKTANSNWDSTSCRARWSTSPSPMHGDSTTSR